MNKHIKAILNCGGGVFAAVNPATGVTSYSQAGMDETPLATRTPQPRMTNVPDRTAATDRQPAPRDPANTRRPPKP